MLSAGMRGTEEDTSLCLTQKQFIESELCQLKNFIIKFYLSLLKQVQGVICEVMSSHDVCFGTKVQRKPVIR